MGWVVGSVGLLVVSGYSYSIGDCTISRDNGSSTSTCYLSWGGGGVNKKGIQAKNTSIWICKDTDE